MSIAPGLQAFQEALYLACPVQSVWPHPLGMDDLIRVVDTALNDAGINGSTAIPLLISIDGLAGLPLHNLLPRHTGAVLSFLGSSTSLSDLLDAAGEKLDSGVEAVVIAACQVVENSSNEPVQNPGLSFDRNGPQPIKTNGCAAVVLQAADRRVDVNKVYAVIEGVGVASQPDLASAIVQASRQALSQSERQPEDVGCLEVSAFGPESQDEAEMRGLGSGYQPGEDRLTCAIGSSTPLIGSTGCAAGMIGLVRVCLSLSQRFLPSVPNWEEPRVPDAWDGTPFYVPETSRTWFLSQGKSVRVAALNIVGPGSRCTHVILTEAPGSQRLVSEQIETLGAFLFPLAGDTPDQLLAGLNQLAERLKNGQEINSAVQKTFEHYHTIPNASYALGIMGHNRGEVLKEIEFAEKGIRKSFENGSEWQTPSGSYLTAKPLGKEAQVAFVYPGAFNSYLGIGRDLFYAFPGLYNRFSELTGNIGGVLQAEHLYPRGRCAFTPAQLDLLEAHLNENPILMLTSGAALAVLYTLVLQEWFGVKPGSVFGYSLGETSMMFASQAWTEGEITGAALTASPLFKTRIAGPKETVREYWGLTDRTDPDLEDSIWANYILMAPADQVYPAIHPGDHVYLTHINTPRQVVIGGDPQSCQEVIQRVGCPSLKAPFDHVLHCEVMTSEFNTLAALSTWPIRNQPSYPLISAADYQPLRLETRAVGQSIAKMLCTPLDFPRLINIAYQDGSRIFIELGAGSNCTRWIDETLKGQPHASISINRKGLTDPESILRTLARLVSHRVDLNLSKLYSH